MKNVLLSLGGWLRRRRWWVIGACAAFVMLLAGPTLYAKWTTNAERYDAKTLQAVPAHEIGLVFGAGVLPSGEPTPYLKRRIQTAADLYHAGKVHILLLSGDNSASHYNEPVAMRRYAVE